MFRGHELSEGGTAWIRQLTGGTGSGRFGTLPAMAKREHAEQLARIDLFSGCSKKELREIAKVAEEQDVPAGSTIVSQGDVGQEAFVILEGTAAVRRGNRKVAVCV